MENKTAEKSSIGNLFGFFSDCRSELAKVSKPTKQETIRATMVALFIVIFMSAALALMDVLFNSIMKAVL